MTTGMLPLGALPASSVDDKTRALLDLMAGDPLHATDRRKIAQAIVAEANSNGGRVDPNRLRARLTNPATNELDVYPRMVGSVVGHLARKGALSPVGWTQCTGSTSGNNGKPQRVYRLVDQAAAS